MMLNFKKQTAMKREQIINKIYDKIRDDLLHAKLLYWEEDDTNKYPLFNHLSSGNDISTGRDEIDNLIEQIEIEPLIDEILALPSDINNLKRPLCPNCKTDSLITMSNGLYCMNDGCDYFKPNK